MIFSPIDVQKNNFQKPDRYSRPVRFRMNLFEKLYLKRAGIPFFEKMVFLLYSLL